MWRGVNMRDSPSWCSASVGEQKRGSNGEQQFADDSIVAIAKTAPDTCVALATPVHSALFTESGIHERSRMAADNDDRDYDEGESFVDDSPVFYSGQRIQWHLEDGEYDVCPICHVGHWRLSRRPCEPALAAWCNIAR